MKNDNNTLQSNKSNKSNKSNNLIEILNYLLEKNSYSFIAERLNISIGTIKRWNYLNNIPKQYTFELMKLANISIDYTLFTYKEKDQFFTPIKTAKYCYSKFIEIIKKYNDDDKEFMYIEPSAGNGSFLKILPVSRRIGLDIEPFDNEIIKCDYLEWIPNEDKKYVVIGNPPFGLRGQLALKFINHSYKFADYVCFILPQLFESDGKGVPRKRVIGFNLLHSEKIKTDFKCPDGNSIKVECIFQIWSKYHKNNKYEIIKTSENKNIKVYSLSDGNTSSSIRNKNMFYKCDIYLPSTCFGKENMKYYLNFDDLPRRKGYGIVFITNKKENVEKFKNIKWNEVAFLSTNSAYNIRSSQIISQFND